jgi:fibronectin-binding autotransporter adhesin
MSVPLFRSRFCLSHALVLTCAMLAFTANASANTCIWSGAASALWSNVGNWTSCSGGVPGSGDVLQFPEVASNKTSSNDLAALTTVAGLDFTGASSGYLLSGAALVLGASGISNSNVSGSNTLSMNLALAAAQNFSGNTGAMILNGDLALGGQALTLSSPNPGVAVPWTINGVIGGSGSIDVNGAGSAIGLVLAGNNTFSGPVTLSSGYTQLDHSNALGMADGTVANGISVGGNATLVIGNNIDIGNEALTLAPGGGQNGNGMIQHEGVNQWGGPVLLPGIGTSFFNSTTASDSLQFGGVISGSGGFAFGQNSATIYKLSNAGNSFSGGVRTLLGNAGAIIRLAGDNAVPATSGVLLQGISTFDLNGFDASIASLSCTASDSVIMPLGSALTVGADNSSTTCAGVISGNFSDAPFTVLTKIGSGTLTLTAANTYDGEVDVLGGGLEVSGSLIANPGTAVYVSSGQSATLFGTGAIGKAVVAGKIHGGTATTPGMLSADVLQFNGVGGMTARINSAAIFDRISAASVDLTSIPSLSITLNFVPPAGAVFTLIDNTGAGAVTGNFSGLVEGASLAVNGTTFHISYVGGTGNDVTLTASGAAAGVAPIAGLTAASALLTNGSGSLGVNVLTTGTAPASVLINCAIPAGVANFQITSGAAGAVVAPAVVGNQITLGMTCVPQATIQTATLTCVQSATPAPNPADLVAVISCPALPAPPVVPTAATQIPSLSEFGKLLLMALMLGIGTFPVKRRRA